MSENLAVMESPSTPFLSSSFEPLLDVQEAATLLRIHPKTMQSLARSGAIPCARMGKYWRFRASALDAWVHGQIDCEYQSRRVQ